MYKKSLSGLVLAALLTFSVLSACSDYVSNPQNPVLGNKSTLSTSTNGTNSSSGAVNSSVNTSLNSNTSTVNQSTGSIDKTTGLLDNKSSNIAPNLLSPSVIPSPVTNSTSSSNPTSTQSPSPSPTASSFTSGSAAGQLNVVINPNLPSHRATF